MDPIFIYFSEIDLKDNNKFTLYFSDEQNIQELTFLKDRDYYVLILNCNLTVKEYIDDKKDVLKSYLKRVDFCLKKVPHTKMILIK